MKWLTENAMVQLKCYNEKNCKRTTFTNCFTPTTKSQLQSNEKDNHQLFHVVSYLILRIDVCTAAQQLARLVKVILARIDKSLLVKKITSKYGKF